ncbi:MAG: GTP-dependent dephospho-CoA kinase family protein [Halobacteriota archaeon]
MLTLPESLRSAFKEPLGAIYADAETLLAAITEAAETYDRDPYVIAVGDIVTYHLRTGGYDPDVAVIDGKTKRESVHSEIAQVLDGENLRIEVENPQASVTDAALRALRTAIDEEDRTVIHVCGEEDLLALPAIIAAPLGASIVYGQPDEGMVHVPVTAETKRDARSLFVRFDGDTEAALERIERD